MNHHNSNVLTAGTESRNLGSNNIGPLDSKKASLLASSKLSHVSDLAKNIIKKNHRTALGDIGNCESSSTHTNLKDQIQGDNPTNKLLCDKQQKGQVTMNKQVGFSAIFGSHAAAAGGGEGGAAKPEAKNVKRTLKTVSAATGSAIAAAVNKQLATKDTKFASKTLRGPKVGTATDSKPKFGGGAALKRDVDASKNTFRLPQLQKRQPIPFPVKDEPVAVIPKELFVTETEVEAVSNAFSETRLDIPLDIDARDTKNHILVSEYIGDIMEYMFTLEKKFPIPPRYLEGRPINSRMRSVLIDWLIEVHDQYNFTAETLFLGVKLLDRYLNVSKYVTRQDLQLVGVTALYLAAKYEEVYTPTMKDFAVLCDNAFTTSQICLMETDMLKTLSFDLSSPQPCFFLRRFSKAANADMRLHALAKYIMELSVVDYYVVDLFPSEVAASALGLALMIIEKKPLAAVWSVTLQHHCRQKVANLRPVVLKMALVLGRAHEEPTKLQAVKKKFSKAKVYLRISKSEDLLLENWKERVLSDLQESS